MKKSKRLFYFCSINTETYEEVVKQQLHVGAATNKVLSVIFALRGIGCPAYAVSLPVLGRRSKVRFVGSKLLRNSKKPTIFLPVVSNPVLRRLLGMFHYAGLCIFYLKSDDRVLIYNYSPEYILALLVLKLKGNPAIIDVEDAPHIKTTNFRENLNKFIYRITLALCQKRYFTVSTQIAKDYKLTPFCIIYGSVNELISPNTYSSNMKNTFRVLYGGTICNDTGLQLFCDTINLLSKTTFQSKRKVVFVITGFGGEEEIKNVQSQIKNSQIRIERKPNLPFNEYLATLRSCHAALCLKIPDSEIGATTFPSKVVEITSTGLLLITTKVSDVPVLFSNENAILLNNTSPEELCEALIWAINNPDTCKIRSLLGKSRAIELFSSHSVGLKIKDFIFP